MKLEEIQIGAILGLTSYPKWRAQILGIGQFDENGDLFDDETGYFRYVCTVDINGVPQPWTNKDGVWSDYIDQFIVVERPEPTEEMKPTALKAASAYMEEFKL